MDQTLKIGLLGLGARGKGLLEGAIIPVCQELGAEVSAVYDAYADRTQDGAQLVETLTGKRPRACCAAENILHDPEIRAVIIATSWEQHIQLALEAMRSGKYVGLEVGGAYDLRDCWELVETSERTGVPCMLLENCCFGKRELMVLNMVRLGVLGEIVHCSGGYHHDLREEIIFGQENRHYRLRNYLNRNCENYPTHELGPIAKVLDINCGNRIVSLSSTASCAKGLHEYAAAKRGADDPLAQAEFAQGDVVTTVLKCAKGQTIVLTLDTTLPRTYSRGFTVRGTKGYYAEQTDTVYLDELYHGPEYEFSPQKLWGNAAQFEEKYMHPIWKNYTPSGGHDGMDYLTIRAFLQSVQQNAQTPIDVYDAATWMSISALSEQSILTGGAVVCVPDFTRGTWYTRKNQFCL